MTYLQLYIGYWDMAEPLPNSYKVGVTEEDYIAGAYILLSDEQLAFREAHPEASNIEVLRMAITPPPEPIPEPEPIEPTPEEKLADAKQKKRVDIWDADRASNKFYVNDLKMWLDKSTRTSLAAITIPSEKKAGNTHTTLWYPGEPIVEITVPLEWLEDKLKELELYAKSTYDIMLRNLSKLDSLETIEDVEALDALKDYPEPLKFTLE